MTRTTSTVKTASGSHRIGAAFALMLVFATYLPTLVYDYVPQDQWRTFRYSLDTARFKTDFKRCKAIVSEFYLQTGRPLVWWGECLEHSLVDRVSDFARVRIAPFAMMLGTVALLAVALRRLALFSAIAWGAAGLTVLTHGYAFMYLQGMTALPVLCAVLMSALSFICITGLPISRRYPSRFRRAPDFAAAGLLFVAACSMYPAFAFIIAPLVFAESFFGAQRCMQGQFRRLLALGLFYVAMAVVYLLFTRATIALFSAGPPRDLGNYQFAVNTSLSAIVDRCAVLLQYLLEHPALGIPGFTPWISVALLAAPVIVLLADRAANPFWRNRLASGAIYAVAMPLVCLATAAPWLASFMDEFGFRHAFGLDVMVIMSSAIVIAFIVRQLQASSFREYAGVAVAAYIAVTIIPATMARSHMVQEYISGSQIEVQYLRSAVKSLVVSGDLWRVREIHIIRPRPDLPVGGFPPNLENKASTSANPEHLYQMLTAVLREVLSRDKLREFKIADCRFDTRCAAEAPVGTIILSQSTAEEPLSPPTDAYVIDFRLLQP